MHAPTFTNPSTSMPETDGEFRRRILDKAEEESASIIYKNDVLVAIGGSLDVLAKTYGLRRDGLTKPERQYLPTLSDLVDRLTIVQQKAVFIHDKRSEYDKEMSLLMHDIDLILSQLDRRLGAKEVHAIIVIMFSNRYIWEQESKTRDGSSNEPDAIQLQRLKATHSINGVRNTAKNVLAEIDGGRHDYKIDSLSADLPANGYGDWNVFR